LDFNCLKLPKDSLTDRFPEAFLPTRHVLDAGTKESPEVKEVGEVEEVKKKKGVGTRDSGFGMFQNTQFPVPS